VGLSGWQTVAITIGASGVTALAALLVAQLTGKQGREQLERQLEHEREQQVRRLAHERSEQWTDRLVRAADDFSTGVEQATLGIRDVISAVADKGDVDAASAEAKRRLHEAVARVARIRLLFGDDSPAVTPAGNLLVELDIARGAATKTDGTFAWEKLDKVYRLHEEFRAAAREMIAGP
jgi:gas vesicle protein